MKTVEEEQKLLYFAWLIQNGMSYEAQDMKSDKCAYHWVSHLFYWLQSKLGLGDIGLTLEGMPFTLG